jgi:hypothetical protein
MTKYRSGPSMPSMAGPGAPHAARSGAWRCARGRGNELGRTLCTPCEEGTAKALRMAL